MLVRDDNGTYRLDGAAGTERHLPAARRSKFRLRFRQVVQAEAGLLVLALERLVRKRPEGPRRSRNESRLLCGCLQCDGCRVDLLVSSGVSEVLSLLKHGVDSGLNGAKVCWRGRRHVSDGTQVVDPRIACASGQCENGARGNSPRAPGQHPVGKHPTSLPGLLLGVQVGIATRDKRAAPTVAGPG
jgi:hypothetical protein